MATKTKKPVAPVTGNPLYDAWKAHGLEQGHSISGYDVPFGEGGKRFMEKVLSVSASRGVLTRKYSWAIPSPEAIAWIVDRTKSIVEIGAGRGYWANLLHQEGAEVFAYDTSVVKGKMGRNGWHNPSSRLAPAWLSSSEDEPGTLFYPVKRGGAICAADHPDSALMLCWPPHSSRMARQSLKFYPGNRLLYIGEYDGCCADSKFFEQLENEWEEVERFDIPQWPGIRDHIWYLVRK